MRNLKRVLSLTLASVMLLGMMVIGSSAVEAKKINFTDADEIEYTEAVDVMVALGVLEGNPDGGFNPKGTLTREQAAKIICYMLLGAENAEKLTANKDVFTDVAANRWSAGYISYCVERSILAGNGNGSFNPTGELTGVAFGKMLLVALGYDPAIQGYTGSNWALSVAADMVDAGIAPAGVLLNGTMSREQAAQTAFQTLTADLVRYTQKPVVVETADGGTVTVGAGEVVPNITYNGENGNYAGDAIGKDGYNTQQFCEKYFPKLVKASDTDDFGRPGGIWKLNGADICFAVDEASYTYTAKVTGKSLYNTLGKTTVETYGWTVKANGGTDISTAIGAGVGYAELRTAKDDGDNAFPSAAPTGKGVLTEVFVDGVDKTVTMVITNTYVAKVTRVKSVDDGYEVTIRYETTAPASYEKTVTVANNDFSTDDIVLVTVADNEIQTIEAAESVTGEVTALKGTDYIKLDGQQYDRAVGYKNIGDGDTSNPAVGETAVVYLDKYNNMIAVDAEGITVDDYVFITDDSKGLGGLSAEGVFSDGTKKEIKITKLDSTDGKDLAGGAAKNKIWSFTEDDGKYTLKTVANVGVISSYTNGAVEKGTSTVKVSDSGANATVTAGNKTVFVDIKNEKVYEGYANVPSITNAKVVAVKNATTNLAEIVFITDGESSADSSFWFFVKDDKYEETGKSTTYREYTVYTKDGEDKLVTKNMTAPANLTDEDSTLKKNVLYKAKSMSGDELTAFNQTGTTDLTADLAKNTTSGNVDVAKDGVLTLNANTNDLSGASKSSFTYGNSDKTAFLVIEANDAKDGAKAVGIGSAGDIAIRGNGTRPESIVYVLAVEDKNDTTPLATMVVVVNPAEPAPTPPLSGPKTWTADVTGVTGVHTIMVSGTTKAITTDFATTFGTEQTVGNYKVSYANNTLTFTGKDNTIVADPVVYYSTSAAVSKSNTSEGANAVTAQKATGSVTLVKTGDQVVIDGSTLTYDALTDAVTTDTPTTNGNVTYTVAISGSNKTVAMTAKDAGVAGNSIEYTATVNGTAGSATALTGGVDGVAAKGAKADYALSSWTAGAKAFVEGKIYTSTGNIATDFTSLAKTGLTFTYAGSTITATTTATGTTAQSSAINLTVFASVTELSVTEVTE